MKIDRLKAERMELEMAQQQKYGDMPPAAKKRKEDVASRLGTQIHNRLQKSAKNTSLAGWYPDPSAPGNERWWDGEQWTKQTLDWTAPTSPQPAAKKRKKTWLVIGGFAALLLLAALAGDPAEEPTGDGGHVPRVPRTLARADEVTTTIDEVTTTVDEVTTTVDEVTTTIDEVTTTSDRSYRTGRYQLVKTIADELGDSDRGIVPKSTVQFDPEGLTGRVLVQWAHDKAFTIGSNRREMQKDTGDVLRHVNESGVDYTEVEIIVTAELIDPLGNEKEVDVVLGLWSKGTIQQINFENIAVDNLWEPSVADRIFVHPALG